MVQQEAESLGWEVLGSGWPDFLMINPETDKIVAIEVKAAKRSGAKVRPNQRKMHKTLKKLGIEVKVIRVGAQVDKHCYKVKEALES